MRTRTRLVVTLFVMLLVLILTPALASTEYDISSMSAEELAALQAMIDARNEELAANLTTSIDIINSMIEAGASIDPEKVVDYDEDTDVNGLLGKEGSYTSKTDFGCIGYGKTYDGYFIGGTLEVFDNPEYALNRFNYLKNIYITMPDMQDKHMYLYNSALLRIDDTLDSEVSSAILAAFCEVINVPETDSFNAIELPTSNGIEITESASSSIQTEEVTYEALQKGSKGSNVAALQSRLKELGFLNDIADGVFGGNTQKAVEAFQDANGLEVTGIATPENQKRLFGDGVIASDGTTRKAYDPLATCPIELSGVKLKTSYGMPYVTFNATNISSSTVTAFTYEIRVFDAYGDRLVGYGDDYIGIASETLSSGKKTSVSTYDNYDMFFDENSATCQVCIKRVRLEDGTDISYNDPIWFEGKK